jgi:DNA-directed RNA polymerase specialized sigma24 family protein
MDGPAPTDTDVQAYSEALFRHVLRRLARRADVSPFDRDDIAMDTVERFLADTATVMAHYPEPHIYAAACVAPRTEDWRRKERAQRSEGARLVAGADGAPAVARPVGTLSTMLPGQLPAVPGGYDAVELLADLRAALAALDRTDRELVVHVDFLGYSVTDAALLIGMSRGHASRRHTQALAHLAASLQEPLAC